MSGNAIFQKMLADYETQQRNLGLQMEELRSKGEQDLAQRKAALPKKLRRADRDAREAEILAELQPIYQPQMDELYKQRARLTEDRWKATYRLAPDVDFTQAERVPLRDVENCDTGAYRSQGYGAATYARGALQPKYDQLLRLGFQAEIRRSIWDRHLSQPKYLADDEYPTREQEYSLTFHLWTDAPVWAYEAARALITEKQFFRSIGVSVNPCALIPGLPDSAIDRWCRVVMNQSQQEA